MFDILKQLDHNNKNITAREDVGSQQNKTCQSCSYDVFMFCHPSPKCGLFEYRNKPMPSRTCPMDLVRSDDTHHSQSICHERERRGQRHKPSVNKMGK